MNDQEIRSVDMVQRVKNHLAQEVTFPAGSMGAELAATISAGETQLSNHAAQQVSGGTSARQGTLTKALAREALRNDLERIRSTARSMAQTIPGLDGKFRIPRKASDLELLAAAQATATDAVPVRTDFIRFAMPDNFIDELNEHIADFEAALTTQRSGLTNRVEATAAIDETLAEVLDAIRQLDPIIRNMFHGNAAKLAAWTSARHIERAPQRQPLTASPGSSPTPPST